MVNPFCDDDSLTPEEQWHKIYGTNYIGNLPQYKANQHVGKSFAKCPYSTQAPELRTRHMLGISISGTLPTRVNHIDGNGTEYFMKTDNKGEWGYSCTFENCPYKLDTGQPYFYR